MAEDPARLQAGDDGWRTLLHVHVSAPRWVLLVLALVLAAAVLLAW